MCQKIGARTLASYSFPPPFHLDDFDDGGALPEIHVAQYPRHMGTHLKKRGQGNATLLQERLHVEVDKAKYL
jgi:hypothetical protein